MSVNYSAALKTARLQLVADAIEAGSDDGVLQIGTAGMAVVLYEVPLSPSVTDNVLALLSAPEETEALATGTAAEARVRDSNNNDVITGLTVGLSASDIIVDALAVNEGQNVRISSATITHP